MRPSVRVHEPVPNLSLGGKREETPHAVGRVEIPYARGVLPPAT